MPGSRFHQPPRPRGLRSRLGAAAVLAELLAELLAALVLSALAWWCWHRGVIISVQQGVEVSRIDGRWWATATAAATLAGILLLDAPARILAGRRRLLR